MNGATLRRRLRRVLLVLLSVFLAWFCFGLLAYRWLLPPATPLMLIRSLELGHLVRYQPRAARAIAPILGRSVIAAEDSHFCLHDGVDLDAVQDAVEDYRESGRLRGASTITMQVARNIFLWPGGGPLRKIVEVPLALAIDALWPKRRILEVYLNIAEWGPGLFGAEAAAHYHFGTTAARLSAQQASRLAAVLPNPRHWSAGRPGPYVLSRSRAVQRETARLGGNYVECVRG